MAFLHCTACKLTWSPYDFIDKRLPCPQCTVATLETRVAELTREREKACGYLAIKEQETRRQGHELAAALADLSEAGRVAAFEYIRTAAARAERDEAAGLLLEDMQPKDDAGISDWMKRRAALLARLAAAPVTNR